MVRFILTTHWGLALPDLLWCAVVVVLSEEYVRKRHPMEELKLLVLRKRAKKDCFCLLPVLYGITYEQCSSLATEYHSEPWVGDADKPAKEILSQWADCVKELLEVTAIREDQVLPTLSEGLRTL